VIIGAGPAGSAAAILLARAGWAVALVERQRFPRRKVCGECIAASNLPLLEVLGVGDAIQARAGPELRRVLLLRGDRAVGADLPAAEHPRYPWGRALGRETLDSLLLEQARMAGAEILQPWSAESILGRAGAWHCELRGVESAARVCLRTPLLIDAHGAWEDLPSAAAKRRAARSAADLFAFKANFVGTALSEGAIRVLALDGGYGGMVIAEAGMATVACCIRRDRLSALRAAAPGQRASEVIQAWLKRDCSALRQALHHALRDGPWLACGPLDPGVRLKATDEIFRIGNAAGEAHPILGEGISMALQSAALLCSHLLGGEAAALAPASAPQAELQRRYVADWRREFLPRLRVAAAFAHVAMRPHAAAALVSVARAWPSMLTHGARWGGKVRQPDACAMSSSTRHLNRGTATAFFSQIH
jgi:menaquinone-9 beta-reductase